MNSSMDLLALAEAAAGRAAAYLRAVERPPPAAWTGKGRHDFVTDADRTAERLIAETLLAGAPGSTVIGEELSPAARPAGLAWIVDPLDGTTNFLHGYPACAVSIAAVADGVLEAGVILRLEPDLCCRAARGHGAWMGDRRLAISTVSDPAHALIGTGFPFKRLDLLPVYQAQFARVMEATSGIRRAGSAALDLADVAAGRFDGFWELVLAPWDMAAGILLVREAGGRVTDLEGNDLAPGFGPVLAGNPVIHDWLRRVLADAPTAGRA